MVSGQIMNEAIARAVAEGPRVVIQKMAEAQVRGHMTYQDPRKVVPP